MCNNEGERNLLTPAVSGDAYCRRSWFLGPDARLQRSLPFIRGERRVGMIAPLIQWPALPLAYQITWQASVTALTLLCTPEEGASPFFRPSPAGGGCWVQGVW